MKKNRNQLIFCLVSPKDSSQLSCDVDEVTCEGSAIALLSVYCEYKYIRDHCRVRVRNVLS